MTNEEAIKMLKQWNEDLLPYEDEKAGIECHNIAISALEKQIPKKVVEKNFVEDVSLNYCPYCNCRFIGWGMKHCGECGQALDWSEIE